MSKDLVPFESDIINPKQLEAYNSLTSKKIPKDAIQSHPGAGGKTFTYIDHVWVTETLQDALGNTWSWDVLKWEVLEDKTVVVLGKLTVYFPLTNGQIFERSITEVGSFMAGGGKMTISNMIASAASRALCRCAMRMFGLGIEFYKKNKEDEPTPEEAWGALRRFIENQGQKYDAEFKKVYAAKMKEAGIDNDNILDRYTEAYKLVAELLGKGKPKEGMPEA